MEFKFEGPTWLEPTAWDELPTEKKADIIKVGVRNGLLSMDDIKLAYNRSVAGEDIYGEGGVVHPSVIKAKAEGFGRFLANGGKVENRYDGTTEDTQYIDKVGQRYYDYTRPDHPLTQNVTLKDVVITPERNLSPEERNYRERMRQKYLRDYAEQQNREYTVRQVADAQREWEKSAQKRALDYGIEAAQGIGMASDITGTLFGGIPVYSGMKGAQALDRAIQTGEPMDYVDAGVWLSPMLTVAGKKVYDTAKPVVNWIFREGTPAAKWAELGSLHSINNSVIEGSGAAEQVPDYKFIGFSLADAKKYKASDGYKALAERAGLESAEMGTGFFPSETFTTVNEEIPRITFSPRAAGDKGGYDRANNIIDIDLEQSAGYEVPFHEGLHWQNVGIPSIEIGPNYQRHLDAVANDVPVGIRNTLLKAFRQTPEKERLAYRENAMSYLRKKTDAALSEDYPIQGYMRNPEELQANGTETGKALGIEPFAPYPGYEEAKAIVPKAIEYNENLRHVKADTPEEVENFWKIITGNYIPAVIGGVLVNEFIEE